LKNTAIAHKNAAISYSCVFIAAFPKTAYTVRL